MIPDLATARSWLEDHLDELRRVPLRLHDAAIGDDGAPRYSAAFWSYLTASPFATKDIVETRTCPHDHSWGEPCDFCGGSITYDVPRVVYVSPLSAAFARLRKAPPTSPQWPGPYTIVISWIANRYDLAAASEAFGRPYHSEDERKTVEAAVLLSCRKLVGRYATGPVARRGISESQSQADYGTEAA